MNKILHNSKYSKNFSFATPDDLQFFLDEVYGYQNDIATKVFHRMRLNLFYSLMQKLIKKKKITVFDSALDIGCNSGYYSKMISDLGFKKVTGIDISDAVDNANSLFSDDIKGQEIKFFNANAEDFESGEKYNFILCTEVIEHTINPTKVVENINNLLTTGGIAIITLPNVISFPYLKLILSCFIKRKKMNEDLKAHISYPFYKSRKLFKNSNIKIIYSTGTNLFFSGAFLKYWYKSAFFGVINKLNQFLSGLFPFKYFTQFYFIVLKKTN